MELIKNLWAQNKPLVIVMVVAIIALLWYIWKQNGNNTGTTAAATSATNDGNIATTESNQLSDILAALGDLRQPVTTTILPPPVTITNPITVTVPATTPVTTNPTSVPSAVIAGIGNDTARDAAIKAAEAKYNTAAQAVQLHAAIAAIQAQYPRSGATI